MAEKKFYTPEGIISGAEVAADYAAAARFDTVRVGRQGVYYREGLRTRYIPYEYIERVFIRIQEVNARVCCGSTCFTYYRLVFMHGGKEFADVLSESEKAMDGALACIKEAAPSLSFGVPSDCA